MSTDNLDGIAMVDAKHAVLSLPSNSSLEDKIKAAMRATKSHWLLAQMGKNDGREMRAAIGGLGLALGLEDPDFMRVAAEHRSLATLSHALQAASAGVPVDWDSMTKAQELPEKPIGLLNMWKEI